MSVSRWVSLTVVLVGLGFGEARAQTSVPTREPEALLIEYTGPVQLSNDFMVTNIRIRNRTGATRRWDFEFNAPRVAYNDGGRRSRFELEVAHGEDRQFELLVPLAGAPDASWIQMAVFGHGIANAGQMQLVANTASSTVALSADVAMEDEHVQLTLLSNHGPGEPLSFIGHDLTDDGRAYEALAALWLTRGEWSEAAPGVRRALRGWAAEGGRLVIVEPGDTKAADTVKHYGMGVIVSLPAGLAGADIAPFVDALVAAAPVDEPISWARSLVEPVETHNGVLSLLLLGYLVLAGPVNLFVFAPRAKRMRLFWTMPTIALATSGVMAVVILLQDGVGGSGVRASFVYLHPELNRELVVQEQVSRTGALLRRGFEITGAVHVTDLSTSAENSSSRRVLASFGDDYYGDWFRSRSVQAQRLRVTRASRARVELVDAANDELAVLSSIDDPLEEIFFRDHQNRVWHAENVLPGRPAVLRFASEQEYNQFRREVSSRIAGPRIRHHAEQLQRLRGTFLAKAASGGSDAAIETLSSIRWRESPVYYAGHVDEQPRGRQ